MLVLAFSSVLLVAFLVCNCMGWVHGGYSGFLESWSNIAGKIGGTTLEGQLLANEQKCCLGEYNFGGSALLAHVLNPAFILAHQNLANNHPFTKFYCLQYFLLYIACSFYIDQGQCINYHHGTHSGSLHWCSLHKHAHSHCCSVPSSFVTYSRLLSEKS